MDGPSTSAAALREEIARLTGAIDRFKASDVKPHPGPSRTAGRSRSNVYVNPNYKPPSKSSSSTPAPSTFRTPQLGPATSVRPDTKRDVVIGGVAFESSGRTLVRKDLAASRPTVPTAKPTLPNASFARSHAAQFTQPRALPPSGRIYKPKASRRGRPMNRNMTLTNNRRPNGARRRKYVDKPCPRFTTTGACNRGLTCPYQHDPTKIAICWPFLQGTCPHTATTCALSHDPIPERTPLCVHFANAGRCTRENCPFPHVRVGPREGVCRDFAVLGYCAKGLDCEHQHVRECPDFAEKGTCGTKGCKLPHVIRANRNRPKAEPKPKAISFNGGLSRADSETADSGSPPSATVEDAQLGDEYISLTFNESESDDDADDDEDEEHSGEEVVEDGDADEPRLDDSEEHLD